MRVAMVDPANLTPFYSYALCDSLAKNSCQVTFYTTEYDNDLTLSAPDSFNFSDHYFRLFRDIQRSGQKLLRKVIRGASYHFDHRSLIKKISQSDIDIVHIQWAMLPYLDNRFVQSIQKLGIPVVLTIHDVNPLFNMGSSKNINQLYQQVDAIVVHNKTAAADLIKLYPETAKSKISIIPHGPLQAEDIPEEKTISDARAALDIPIDADTVCFFGEIKHYKGLDYLLKSCLELKKTKPNLFLLIAGKPGDESDIPDLSALDDAEIAYKADIGFIANEDVWKYYLAADIIALPYRQISQSGVLFSALAHQRYVICSAVGALPEILDEVGGGCTFTKGNTSELCLQLNEKLDDKEKLFSDAKNALIKVEELYGWASISEKTKHLYSNL